MANELIVKNGLKVDTTTGALSLPVLTSTQRNALSAVSGMIIYNSSSGAIEVYSGSAWLNPAGGTVSASSNLFNYYNFA